MVNKELLEYIRGVQAKGFADDKIRATLLSNNYTQEIIDDAFKEILESKLGVPLSETKPAEETSKPILAEKKKKPILPLVLASVFTMLILGGIAFAVYMFIGSGPINFTSDNNSCANVTADIYKLKGEPVVCIFTDKSKVQLILINNGDVELNRADINIFGENGMLSDKLSNLNLKPNDVFTRTLSYDFAKAGEPKSIELVPYGKVNGFESACTEKKVTYDKIGNC